MKILKTYNQLLESKKKTYPIKITQNNHTFCIKFLGECQSLSDFLYFQDRDIKYYMVNGFINGRKKYLKIVRGILYEKINNVFIKSNYKINDINNISYGNIYVYKDSPWVAFTNNIFRLQYDEESPYKWNFSNNTVVFENGNKYEYNYSNNNIRKI